MELKQEQRYNQAWIALQKESPFYTHILSRLSRKTINDGSQMFPAAITANDNGTNIILIINEFYMKEYTPSHFMAILQHEMLHIIFHHLTVMRRCFDECRKLSNICADLAVNQYITGLPLDAITLKSMIKNFPEAKSELLPKLSGIKYYSILRKYIDKSLLNNNTYVLVDPSEDGEDGEGKGKEGRSQGGKLQKHWHDLVGHIEEKDVAKVERLTRHITVQAKNKSAGNMPNGIEVEIEKLYTTTICWRTLLQTFIDRVIPGLNKRPVFHRPSRRYGSIKYPRFPGYVNELEPKLLAMVDTSGSMGDEDLGLAIGELKRVAASGYQVDVAEVDTDVHRLYDIKNWDHKIHGRGGTCFNSFFKMADTLPHSGVIIITDGYLYGQSVTCVKQLIWIITPGGSTNNKKGLIVEIGKDYKIAK